MKRTISTLKLTVIVISTLFSFTSKAQDSLAFGDKNWINSGLEGKIYFLAEGTDHLPDFDTMRAVGNIYTKEINVPSQSWDNGFPGVTDRFEWFGIEYKSEFKVKKAGHYTFRLHSDDGAKLFIDGKLVINNDGLHSPRSEWGEIDLNTSRHNITIQYYQGPRHQIALQLFYSYEKEEEKIFSGGTDFMLSTPAARSGILMGWWLIIIIIIFLITILIWIKRKRRSVIPAIYSGRI